MYILYRKLPKKQLRIGYTYKIIKQLLKHIEIERSLRYTIKYAKIIGDDKLLKSNKKTCLYTFLLVNLSLAVFTIWANIFSASNSDSAITAPAKLFISAMYLGLIFVFSGICGYHSNKGGLLSLIITSLYPIAGAAGMLLAAHLTFTSANAVSAVSQSAFLFGATPVLPLFAALETLPEYGLTLSAFFSVLTAVIAAVWLFGKCLKLIKVHFGLEDANNAIKVDK